MTRAPFGPELDTARATVVARGLTGAAVGALTETVRALPLDALTPVKQSLKHFFSEQPWTERDADALAAVVGAGSGSHDLALDADLTLRWGWEHDRFFLRLAYSGTTASPSPDAASGEIGLTFESEVYPEVTPSPRTIRFTTPPLHSGASQVFDSSVAAATDPRVARLFREFDAVTNVLVGPTFVAVTIAHADQWEMMLASILRAVTEEFAGAASNERAGTTIGPIAGSDPSSTREPRRLERAWAELGAFRADRPADLVRVLAASHDDEPAHRQVASALLADAPPAVAAEHWARLLGDRSRSVRRSTVDAVVDARREELRGLLERALGDTDAWVRWKAVHGLAALGLAPSRAAIEACASDPDFRVRLEVRRVIAAP